MIFKRMPSGERLKSLKRALRQLQISGVGVGVIILLVLVPGAVHDLVIFWAKTVAEQVPTHLANFLKEDPKPERAVIRISAADLLAKYNANEVAADALFAGKDIIVSGRVLSINKNFWGTTYVLLETPNLFAPAHVSIVDADTATAAALRKGQMLEARCTSVERWMGSPMGGDCRILSAR